MEEYIKKSLEIDWRLENFTVGLAKYESKEILSENFNILFNKRVTKWCFSIQIRENNLSIFLLMKESKIDDFQVIFNVCIHKVNGEKEKFRHFSRHSRDIVINQEYGCSDYISIPEICEKAKTYLKEDDTLTLGFKVTLVKTKRVWKKIDKKNCKSDCQYLAMCRKYFDTKSLSDFTVVCSDKVQIPVHITILSSFSPVFDALFKSFTAESKISTILIEDIDGQTMTEILRFIYTQEVQNMLDLAPKILYGAVKYDLNGLIKVCAETMIENLCCWNAVDYFIMAEKHNIKDLLEHCVNFIKMNFKGMSREKNWHLLDKKHMMMILECFEKNPKNIRIFETILQ
ncbi:speckle-type POZ protein-like [Chironomus tepperi]|uniref:speckle-type POZ protein-like n=1 Tax=Chironomus tepperi TaxID=113505 RepID=UPI00391F62B7